MKLVKFSLGNLLVFYKYLFEGNKLWKGTDAEFVWNRKFAQVCAVYPVYFPYKIVAKKIFKLMQSYFNFVSYRNINSRITEANNFVYVSLDNMKYFTERVLPEIKKDFNLVTGDSDLVPSDYNSVLENSFLKNWFCQNCDIVDERVHPLPIGLDYHTIYTYPFWGSRRISPEKQEEQLKEIMGSSQEKEMKIFSNFHINLNSERREELYRRLKDSDIFHFQTGPLSRLDTWREQKKCSFVFSPAGVGMDCHRTYEALLLGCIPIVESGFLDEFYKNFPVVVINRVDELTRDNLIKWEVLLRPEFNSELDEKLKSRYWLDMIRKTAERK